MTEAAHHDTFVGTRTCIESRVKLECEKEQQEQLLLSVIPAYIAAEVSVTHTRNVFCRKDSTLLVRDENNMAPETDLLCPLNDNNILGAFEMLRRVTVSYVVSCDSSAPTGQIFVTF